MNDSSSPARTRHEAQIKRFNSTFGRQFDAALDELVARNGLGWFSDEQIAEIRAEMIGSEWNHRRRLMECRALYATIREKHTSPAERGA